MKSFRESLKNELKNPEFKKEWDALDPEFRRIRQTLDYGANDNTAISRIVENWGKLPESKNFYFTQEWTVMDA